jgi:endonuclease/exonuclease/phosphatase (EEP) superfamily protein YafD
MTLGALLTSCVQIPPQDVIGGVLPMQTEIVGGACDVARREKTSVTHTNDNGLYLSASEPLRLITWNIHKQKDTDWYTDFTRLSRDRDLFVLQEAYFDEKLASALAGFDYDWSMATAWRSGASTTGVLTAARASADYQCTLRAIEPLTGVPKSILVSRFPIAGTHESLMIANVHGINFTLGVQEYRQQFVALERVLREHRGPLILAGDFNTWRQARLQIIEALADRLSLENVNYLSHNRIRVFGNPIDHVYYRGLEVIDFSSPTVSSSDHNPLLMTFKLKQET